MINDPYRWTSPIPILTLGCAEEKNSD
jgi:hypothetical protein